MLREHVLLAAERSDGEPEPWSAGRVIADKYRLERRIGEGGMGAVWLATNVALETSVAIKVIRRDTPDVAAPSRLLREARAAAQLRHPSIVRVFDFGIAPGDDAYIVMELLEGASLRDHLNASGPLAAETAASILLPIVDGLAAAHERGVVHRDLKPENILLARDDTGRVQPKVVDFGLAKVVRNGASARQTTRMLEGTPQYMAPELALGLDDIDPFRVDVWALGVIFYELLTDAFVFDADTPREVLELVVRKDPAPLVGVRGVDEALWAIMARSMAKDPAARCSARELHAALGDWLLERGVTADVGGTSVRSSRSSFDEVPVPSVRTPAAVAAAVPSEHPSEHPSVPSPPSPAKGHVVTRLTTTLLRLRPRRSRLRGRATLASAAALTLAVAAVVTVVIALFARARPSREMPMAAKVERLVGEAAARASDLARSPPPDEVAIDVPAAEPTRAAPPPAKRGARRAPAHPHARPPASKKLEDKDLGF